MIEISKMDFYYMRKKAGVCPKCGKEDAFTMGRRTYCADCAEIIRKNEEKRLADPEKRAAHNENVKERRHRRIEQGLCPNCGGKPMKGHVKCLECTLKQRKADAKKRGGYHPRMYGICWQCNKEPVMQDKKLCLDCYEMALKKIEKANKARMEREIYPYWSGKSVDKHDGM